MPFPFPHRCLLRKVLSPSLCLSSFNLSVFFSPFLPFFLFVFTHSHCKSPALSFCLFVSLYLSPLHSRSFSLTLSLSLPPPSLSLSLPLSLSLSPTSCSQILLFPRVL